MGRRWDSERIRYSMITVIGAGAPTTVHDVRQVELSHRDVFVLLDRRFRRPDVHDLVLRVAIYARRLTPCIS